MSERRGVEAKVVAGYTMDKTTIYRGGKPVGVVKNGSFQLTDAKGRQHAGSFATLLHEHVRATVVGSAGGPTGQLRLDGATYEVLAGVVFDQGKRAGRVEVDGRYSVTIGGKTMCGSSRSTPGAVWLGGAGASGVISIGDFHFHASGGPIVDGASVIGWLDVSGRFRAVRANGDVLEGTLGKPATYLYLRRRKDQP